MPDVPRNIEIFNRVAGVVLLQLYEAFPVPVELEPVAVGTVASEGFTADQDEIFQLMIRDSAAAIEFLAHEGFLTFANWRTLEASAPYPDVRLTMKGLALMGVPNSISSEKSASLGGQLRSALDSGAHDAVASLVGQAFAWATGLGVRALGSIG